MTKWPWVSMDVTAPKLVSRIWFHRYALAVFAVANMFSGAFEWRDGIYGLAVVCWLAGALCFVMFLAMTYGFNITEKERLQNGNR